METQVERTVPADESLIQRVSHWIWQAQELRALKSDRPKSSALQLQFLSRSRGALAVAHVALEPPMPSKHGPLDAVACELYREAVYWALLAQRVALEAEAPRESLESLFKAVDRKLLEHAAGDATRLDEIERAIATKNFTDFAELSRDEQARLTQSLEPFAEALTTGIGARELAIQRIWMRRISVIFALVVLTLGLIWGAGILIERAERAGDLAPNKPWTTSSSYASGCTSPEQSCAAQSGFFFHTAEERNPWLVFDLEKPARVSAVHVFNRTDCCQERGLPLVVELSSDQNTWKEVARRTSQFTDWKAKFATSDARFVRFRAEGTTMLHFSQVRILP